MAYRKEAHSKKNIKFMGNSQQSQSNPDEVAAIAQEVKGLKLRGDLSALSNRNLKKKIVIFFGRETFCDNSKYLFLACAREAPDFQFIWCTWSKALHATLLKNNLPSVLLSEDISKSAELLLSAGIAVFCENPNNALAGLQFLQDCLSGAKKIQLWHGISVKHLDLMLMSRTNVLDAGFRAQVTGASIVDYGASTSSSLDMFWVRAHGTQSLLRVGQPRNEVILREPGDLEFIGAMLSAGEAAAFESAATKILVAPTWNHSNQGWFGGEKCFESLEYIGLKHNLRFFLKLHPFLMKSFNKENLSARFERITFLDPGLDIYPWLKYFSALMTDYSSIMFDYLLTGKPVLLYDVTSDPMIVGGPDFSLVPDHQCFYKFTPKTLEETLQSAFADHPLSAVQERMRNALFETDPLEANRSLVKFLGALSREISGKSASVIQI